MFQQFKLRDITLKIGSGSTPKGGKESYKETGITLIRSLNVYDFAFEYKDLAYIDEVQAKKLDGVKLEKDDILLNITGASVGRCTIVPEHLLPARVNQHVSIIRVDKAKADADFILYCINSSDYKNRLLSISDDGATREALTKDDIEKFEILLPHLSIQKSIASILSAYDDLIEVNTQRIKLLEETASELYKEWFVRMRFPGYKKAKFVKGFPGGLGEVKYFKDFIKLNRGFDLPEEKIVDGMYPVVASTSIKAYHNQFKVKAPIITTGRSGSLGKVLFVNEDGWPLNTSLYVKNFFGNEPIYVYYTLMQFDFESFNSGAGVPTLNQNHLQKLKIWIAGEELQSKFRSIVNPIFEQTNVLRKQNTYLRQIRDRLLPRLISGKLQVKVPSEAKVISINQASASVAAGSKSVSPKKKEPNPYFTRRVLAAYLIDRLHREITFGHVKLMKLMYLCEHVAGIETASHYHRDAAGPYDNQMIRSIDSQLKKANWFECKNEKGKFVYYPLPKKEEYKEWFAKYYNHEQAGIDQLIELFGTKKTEEVEVVATLLEAHRHLVSASGQATDDALVHEVLNNWHESKKRIEEIRWRQGLAWMRQRNWIS